MAEDRSQKSDALVRRPSTALSFDQVERVLRRAAEIQHRDPDDGMSLEEVEAMAQELGVSRDAIQQAYREERSRALVPASSSSMEGLLGRRHVMAQRTVPGSPQRVRDTIDRYLRDQMFRVKRHLGDRVVYEPSGGIAAKLRRALDVSSKYEMPTNFTLDVVVTATDGERSDVVLIADLSAHRSAMLATAGTLGGLGLAAGVSVGLLVAIWALPIGAAAGLGGALLSRRAYDRDVTAAAAPLDRMLDALERGHAPGRL